MRLKSYLASILISFIEFFDFMVFIYIFIDFISGSSSSTVGDLFKTIGVLVSFIARPVGAYIFGKIAVNKGRVKCMLGTLSLMLIASCLMIISAFLKDILIVCISLAIFSRFLQGMAIGGEHGNTLLYIYEISKNKATGVAFAIFGTGMGLSLATYFPNILRKINNFETKILIAYGSSILLSLLAFKLRSSMIETRKAGMSTKTLKGSYFENIFIFLKHIFPFVLIGYYGVLVIPTYLHQEFSFSKEKSTDYLSTFMLITTILPIFLGILCDKFGLDRFIKISYFLTALYIPIFIYFKNPILHVGYLAFMVSLYYTVGYTKLFSLIKLDILYLTFPVLFCICNASISSQILFIFNKKFNHDIVLILCLALVASLYFVPNKALTFKGVRYATKE